MDSIRTEITEQTFENFDKKFKVILADPPWSYQNGGRGSAAGEYPCMSLDDICNLKVQNVTDDNCVLFLWATFPLLPEALKVIQSWGFQYKTGLSWVKKTKNNKEQFGTGFIFRSCTELLLVGFKGKPKVKNRSTRNFLSATATGHSIKPDCQYPLIEKLFDGPYLEIFARRPWRNWTGIGNQIFQGQEDFKEFDKKGLFGIGLEEEK